MSIRLGLAILLAASGLVACGGEQAAPKPAPGSTESPLVATRPGELTTGNTSRTVPPGEPSSAQAPAATVRPGYKTLVERQTAKPQERFTPCNLVTRSEAQRILRKPVQAPYEAPQGPTCLYRPRAAGDELVGVTVLENQGLESIRARDKTIRRVDVSGHQGYCGTYGQPMLYVQLDGDKLLTVSGRCEIARAFAVKALPHL